MTHSLHGAGNNCNGFTALETTIGTSDSSARDVEYVKEHEHLKYLRKKFAIICMIFTVAGVVDLGSLHPMENTSSFKAVTYDG